ncbi:MAG TPA: hypothetical protein VET23_16000 [Chitinophagaceae bacterium]|nr:hypothetical protein [Chitinophagaceae bacterium]
MKKIFLLCFVVSLNMLMISCSKSSSNSGVTPPPPQHLPPPAPTTLTLVADSALYDSSATVRVKTDGQTVKLGGLVINDSITFHNLMKDTTLTFTSTNTNEYGSTSKSASIIVHVFDQKTSQIQNYGLLYEISCQIYIDGTENLPNAAYIDGPMDCDTFQMFANGGGKIIRGPCNTCPICPGSISYQSPPGWAWQDSTEQAINFGAGAISGGGDVWNVVLQTNGFDRSQVKNGFYTLQKYRQP